ncbi:MAG: CocE/NonD family hydrolase [Frankiales bacterium]|nr:CocE/NonD family hydrolase [Frankiales bacterium]
MEIRVSKTVMVPMRDGVELGTDVFRTEAEDARPTVLLRLPYDKEMSVASSDVGKYLTAGYVVVVQDTRGRFTSGGVFNPFFDERADGEDTLRWIAEQSWSDGQVVMAGASYFGATQWMLAAGDAPALKAIAANITSDSYYEGWTYQGGAFELGFILTWTVGNLALAAAGRAIAEGTLGPEAFGALVSATDNIHELFKHTPISDIEVLSKIAPYYADWVAHPTDDEFWKSTAPRERYEQVSIPTLNIGGWYDLFLNGTLKNYVGMKTRGGSEAARKPRLVIGPWAHGVSGSDYPWRSFGLMANGMVLDTTGMQIRFYDRHVRGIQNGLDDEPPVKLFVMGANVWRDEADWPLPDTKFTPYYLHSGGNANSSAGDGSLSTEAPGEQRADVYLYDPHHPVPTVGGQTFLPGLTMGANSGPRDRSELETRADVLCFSTPVLEHDTEVTGPVSLILHVTSSAVDTDFTGALVDVFPDGRAVILTEGILRARYRNSVEQAELMEPGQVYELTIDLWATANVFAAGHRIRLEVSSSNFPRFDRNSNTGGVIADESAADFVPAVNRILHDPLHPSRLVLPIIDR